MYTFHIQPDFDKLRICYPQYDNAQYSEIVKAYQRERVFTTDEFKQKDGKDIETGFKQLVEDYKLSEDYDNLLYLALSGYHLMQYKYEAIYHAYQESQRVRELAKLLLIYTSSARNRSIDLHVLLPQETVEVKDQALSKWIGKLIIDAIEGRQFPLTLFGDSAINALFGMKAPLKQQSLDRDRLKAASKMMVVEPDSMKNKLLAELCYPIYSYLQLHTNLKCKPGKMFSNKQLNFFYDLLDVLSFLDNDNVGSPNKDFIGSIMRRHLRKLIKK